MTTDERLQRLTQALSLTDDQQQKIRPILESETQQLDALRQSTTLTGPERRDKMLAIRDTTTSQIKPILNPDQQTKYEQMMARYAPPQGHGQSQGSDKAAPCISAASAVVFAFEDCHCERSGESAFFCRHEPECEKPIPHGQPFVMTTQNDNASPACPVESPPARR